MQENKIYKVLSLDEAAKSPISVAYEGATLSAEGFIHCCYSEQLRYVAAKHFTDQKRLVLRRIDPSKLTSELKVEETEANGRFPHVYGPINPEAFSDEMVWFPPTAR